MRAKIYDHWHKSGLPVDAVFGKDQDAYAAYYTSMFLIQDTGESVYAHMGTGFSSDALAAYVEFWGVLQAIIIQQDAIRELYQCLLGGEPDLAGVSAWLELRDLRNRCAGHPANKNTKGGTLRTFMARGLWSYDNLWYEQFNSVTGQVSHPHIDLRALIEKYDTEASGLLSDVLAEMKRRLP